MEQVPMELSGSNISKKRVLVTGGAGFLGSHLCEALLELGNEVWSVDNKISGSSENISKIKENPNFHEIKADISKPLELNEKIDFIFHFASIADPKLYSLHPIETLRANTFGTYNLLELARKQKCGFLFASTSEVYGDAEVVPTPETYWGNVNPVGPRSCYDESKRCGEAFCVAYAKEYGLDVRIVRIFNTYGPRLRDGRAVPEFVKAALNGDDIEVYGDGKQTRSFCYVTDLIRGILLLASKGPVGEPVNIGNEDEITILELAKKVLTLTGSESRINFKGLPTDDPKRRCPDLTKARELLGYSPKVGLEEGLKLTIEWFNGI